MSRLWAVVLVALIATPFSAPFATCDLVTSRSPSVADQATSHALPLSGASSRYQMTLSTAAGPVVPLTATATLRIDRHLDGPLARTPLVVALRI